MSYRPHVCTRGLPVKIDALGPPIPRAYAKRSLVEWARTEDKRRDVAIVNEITRCIDELGYSSRYYERKEH